MDFARFLDLSPFLDFYLILNFHFWTKMEYYPSVPKNIPNFCRLLLLLILPLITDYQSAIMPIILKKMNCSSNEIFFKHIRSINCIAFLYFKKQDFKRKKNLMNKPHELILRLHTILKVLFSFKNSISTKHHFFDILNRENLLQKKSWIYF